ncbi:MAG: CCA tRNA nucleotidyltransferase [bacterium]|nr:CCA tRNA nucleotidyltransferase [bacterium]
MSSELFKIPKEVADVAKTLENEGFEAYLIGGCVRDTLLGNKPKDWDITTNAKPDKLTSLFQNTFYENDFGTVGVVNEDVSDETLKVVEVTPYRKEAAYSDFRRPDSVSFSEKLEDDLARRDFTVNAIALKLEVQTKVSEYKGHLVDLYKGRADIKDRVIRAVGNPNERFKEDALRTLRAIRLSSELEFRIEEATEKAIIEFSDLLKHISAERIRDEFIRILMSDKPMEGLNLAKRLGVLIFILPELEAGSGIKQNKAHSYDVLEHSLRTVAHSAKKKFPLDVRLAALLHDIGKPKARRWSKEKNDWTFYGHDVIGSRETEKILKRLRFPVKVVEKVVKLVRWHMFFSDTEKITLSAVRRLVRNVGRENVWNLMDVRSCDRIGTGRPKESPYRLRKYHSMIEEAVRAPISVSMLEINGGKIMEVTHETPGPRIGYILHALLEEVLDDPTRNTREYMERRAVEFSSLSDEDLKTLGTKGKEKRESEEEKELEVIRKRHFVK